MKNNCIPLIMVHTGNQPYLKRVIKLAESYGNKVILLGDKSNRKFCKEWCDCSELVSDKLLEFRKKYIHMSTLPIEFERFCFERHFLILEYVRRHKICSFVRIDSDLLIYRKVTQEEFSNCECSGWWDEKCDSALQHFSFYTKRKMEEFVDFCIYCYSESRMIEQLENRWKGFLKEKKMGGNTDMLIQCYWFQTFNGWRNDYGDESVLFLGEGEGIDERFGAQLISFVGSIPYFNGRQLSLIHAGGGSKVYIKPLAKKKANASLYKFALYEARILQKMHELKCKILKNNGTHQ